MEQSIYPEKSDWDRIQPYVHSSGCLERGKVMLAVIMDSMNLLVIGSKLNAL